MRRRKVILLTTMAAVVSGLVYLTWIVLGRVPPRLILTYGLPASDGPTGRAAVAGGIEFVELWPGYFRMGSNAERYERPRHWVEFARPYWLARSEVTNAQFERFDPDHERAAGSPGDGDPVADVTWREAQAFCAWLSEQSGVPVRLPSEAELECAARAGRETEYYLESPPAGRTNAWGIIDLHGGVWEWCGDTFHPGYEGAPATGAAWVDEGAEFHVARGGCVGGRPESCRSTVRLWATPGSRIRDLGFRPAFSLPRDRDPDSPAPGERTCDQTAELFVD